MAHKARPIHPAYLLDAHRFHNEHDSLKGCVEDLGRCVLLELVLVHCRGIKPAVLCSSCTLVWQKIEFLPVALQNNSRVGLLICLLKV